jgi:competence protein ComEA
MRFLGIFLLFIVFGMTSAEAVVNINTADAITLQQFNGVGPVTAQKIIDYRVSNGEFKSCDSLTNIKGIGPATLTKIKPDCIVVDGEEPKASNTNVIANVSEKFDLNTASQAQLETISGIGPSKAAAIISYRNEHGPFKNTVDVVNVSGIGPKTAEKINSATFVVESR